MGEKLTMKSVTAQRHITHIILSMIGAGFCIGLTNPLLEELLKNFRFDDWYINILAFIEAIGFLFMAPFIPWLLKHFKHDLLVIMGLLLIGGVLIIIPFMGDSPWIFAFKFFMGVGEALIFIVGATLVNILAEKNHRGAMIGFFAASFFGAEGLSPLLLSILPYKLETMATIVVLAMVICMIPLLFSRCNFVHFRDPINVIQAKRLVGIPIIIIMAFMQSFNQTAFEESFSLYADQMGLKEGNIMLMNTILLMGGVFLCGLVGILIDKYGHYKVVLGLMIIIFTSYIIIYIEGPIIYGSWMVFFFLGGAVLSMYMGAMVIMARIYKGMKLAGALAGFLIVSTVAELIGAFFLGIGMDERGAQIFPLLMLYMNGICIVSYIWLLLYKSKSIT